jgi:acyl-CoA synthetase (AMP-forming)/AMP-acid ligase II/acyl carrier protein
MSTVPSTLIEMLRSRAQDRPEQRAYTFLIDGEEEEISLSCAELNRRARAIGALLQEHGASGERVLLLYPPGLEFMPAFWGCLYAGAVAVPAYPPRPNRSLLRLQAIVADAQAAFVLTTSTILARLKPFLEQVPGLQKLRWLATESLGEVGDDWQTPATDKDSLAFIQYTSGSTGTPKGVMLSHENLLHNAFLVHQAVKHEPDDKYVSWLPTFHDMGFMAGVLQPLYGGFPVILMSPASFLQRPVRWLQAVSRYRATTSGGPNFAYEMCVRKISEEQLAALDLSNWSVAFNGAEAVRPETLQRFTQVFAACGFRREAFYPCYGLAEATLMVSGSRKPLPLIDTFSAKELEQRRVRKVETDEDDARALVGCGRTMKGQKIVIADPELLTTCAESEVGEIWVKGKSVARGYWMRPEETREIFQACLKDSGEGPFLRTGDLGFLQSGELFVTGRLKDLIIIRGRNHYPQDIEYTVERCSLDLPAGGAAAFSIEVAGEERLVVFREVGHRRPIDPGELATIIRQAVADTHELQTYAVVLLRSGGIPKTSSGKTQRHACRDGFLTNSLHELFRSVLDESAVESDKEETLTLEMLLAVPLEERPSILLAELRVRAARLLKIAAGDLDPQQPLTAYGLDSLAAIELKYQLESEWGIAIPFEALLHNGSLTRLSALILEQLPSAALEQATTEVPAIKDGDAESPLSYVQQTLWFLYQLVPESGAYNIASAFRIRSEIDVTALRFAFHSIVNRHAVLRTTYSMRDGQPLQHVHPNAERYFVQHDASALSLDELHARLEEQANQPFDLVEGPAFNVHLFSRSAGDHTLLVVVHHIAFDGWSFWLLLNELSVLYGNALDHSEITLLAPARQYTDYVHWQAQLLNGPRGAVLSKYWHRELGTELPVPNLQTTVPRSLAHAQRGDSYGFTLSTDLITRLKQLAAVEGATLYTILLTALQVLLHRYTGQEELVIGTPAAGRTQAEFESVIGCFMNPVGLRCDMSGDPRVKSVIGQMQEKVWRSLDHQDYPSHLLAEQLQRDRLANRLSLFPIMFIMQKAHASAKEGRAIVWETGQRLKLGDLNLEIIPLRRSSARSELELEIVEGDKAVFGEFQYNAELFDEPMIARMAAHYETLLESIAANPDQRLSLLQILTEDERRQLLVEWPRGEKFAAQSETIDNLFNRQVLKTPAKAAGVYQGKQLTFRELQERASKLAGMIRELKND